jgi:hypothetical protein
MSALERRGAAAPETTTRDASGPKSRFIGDCRLPAPAQARRVANKEFHGYGSSLDPLRLQLLSIGMNHPHAKSSGAKIALVLLSIAPFLFACRTSRYQVNLVPDIVANTDRASVPIAVYFCPPGEMADLRSISSTTIFDSEHYRTLNPDLVRLAVVKPPAVTEIHAVHPPKEIVAVFIWGMFKNTGRPVRDRLVISVGEFRRSTLFSAVATLDVHVTMTGLVVADRSKPAKL